ncbi:MAG: hypothetical protein IPJ68_03245 [Candidatus Moraniibacteriota bacterium]|nr:MAG: hypothetical protein IPJ68_03245 [Candidatus Moranbacteria bacterium]
MCVPWNTQEYPLHTLFLAKGRDTCIALNEKRYFSLATEKFRQYYAGTISLRELEEEYRVYERDARQLYDEVTDKTLSELADAELQEYMLVIMNRLYPELLATIYIETIDHDKILDVIGIEHRSELDAIWERATQATFVSFEGRYLCNMTELVAAGQGDIVRKAKFMFTDYFRSKSDDEIAVALDDVRSHLPEKTQEAERLYTEAQDRANAHLAWRETLTPDARRLVEYAQLVMRLRDIRKDPIAQMLAVMLEVGTLMTERAGIEPRFVPYILLAEYTKGVAYLKSKQDDISTRDQGCLYLANPDHSYEVEYCDFPDAIAQFDAWTKHQVHDSSELKGQTACRGRVQGIVRVVSDPHDDHGFQEGDILVTSMTRPEFVPIMKRAGAVVTNEGGITCHAAIVSRELGIPCIIGTKIATQVLKDGDLVEVNANEGVVRILGE